MNLMLKMIGWRCWCRRTSWVFTDNEGCYVRCLDCGRRLPYNWTSFGNGDAGQTATPRLTHAELKAHALYNRGPNK